MTSMMSEIEKILARGDDVMIKRKRENGKPIDVVFAIKMNIAAKEEVSCEKTCNNRQNNGLT